MMKNNKKILTSIFLRLVAVILFGYGYVKKLMLGAVGGFVLFLYGIVQHSENALS